MTVADSQKVDLLYKKLFGVAKTDLPGNKGASNESIASPAFLRADQLWLQASSIPGTAADTAGIVLGYQSTSKIQCVSDTTSTPVSSIYPTWKTNLTDWIPPEFGSSYFIRVYYGNSGLSDPASTGGTQIFDAGSGGTGEWFFDYKSGVLNFIGGTNPTGMSSSHVLYIYGYRYIGPIGTSTLYSNSNVAAYLPTYQGALTANSFNAASVYAGTIGNTGATLTGTLSTAAQTNITSLGTLTSLSVTGTSTLGAVTASTLSAGTIGNAGASLQGASIAVTGASTANSYAAISVFAGTIGNTGANLVGTINTNAQPYITSVGTLSSLAVTGTLGVSGTSTLGAVTASTLSAGTIGNTGASLQGASIAVTGASTANSYAAIAVYAGTIGNTGANLVGTINTNAQPYITSVGTLSSLAVTGGITGNSYTGVAVYAGTIGNTGSTLTGTLSTAAQTNITSLGTLTSLSSSGNITAQTANVYAGNLIANTAVYAGSYYYSNGVTITTPPGGLNTYVQFNDSGVFNGTAGLTFNKSTNALGVTGAVTGNTFTGVAVYAGTIGNTGANLAGTVTTATQNSITTMTGLTGFGTAGITTTAAGNFTVAGNLTIQGNTSTIGSSDLVVQDSIINLHTYANLAPWTSNDGRDIGIKFHYYDNADKHAFLGRANDTGYLEFYANGNENASNVFTGTDYGTIKAGDLWAANTTASTSTATGALKVSGGAGITGAVYANSFNGVSVYAGTIGNTGANLVGTINTNAQPYITSVGTLTSVATTGASTANSYTGVAVYAGTIGNTGATLVGTLTGSSISGTVPTANVSIYANVTNTSTNATFYPVFVNATSGNLAISAYGGLAYNPGTGQLGATSLSGTIVTASQPNITSLGVLTSLGVSGTSTLGAVTASTVSAGTIGNSGATLTGATLTTSGVISASGNIVAAATTSSTSTTTGSLVVKGGAGIAGDVKIGTSLEVNSGAYGNVTTTQFASVFGAGGGPNPYSVMQVRSSDGVSGIGMQAYTGSGVLYGNVIGFVTNATIRDRDVYSGGTLTTYFASNGAIINTTGIASTSTGTGALIVSGGAGISGAVYANSFNGISVYAGTIGNTGANLVGTINTNAQPYITSVGTLSSLAVTGGITGNSFAGVAVYAGTIGNTGATLTGSSLNITGTSTFGNITANTISAGTIGNTGSSVQGATGAFTGAVTGNTFTGVAVYAGTIGNTSTNLVGTIQTSTQNSITSVGTLNSLAVNTGITANTFTGYAVYANTIGNTGATLVGLVGTNAQPFITSLGTLSSLVSSGNITAQTANVYAANLLANTAVYAGNYYYSNGATITTPAGGSNTYIQFNDNGVFNGTAGLTFNKGTNSLTVSGPVNGNTFTGIAVYAGTIGNTGASLIGTVGTATQNSITTMTGLTGFGTTGVTTTASGNFTIAGNLTVQGNTSTIGSADLVVQDSIINLHTYANLAPWASNDGRDIGIKFHYYDNADKHAFLGRTNSSGYLEFYANGTENASNIFTGTTYGTIRSGELLLANSTASTGIGTGALIVGGGAGITGAVYANSFNGVSVYAGTIGNTGAAHVGSTFSATGAVTGNTFTGIAVYGSTIGNTGTNLVGTINTNAQPYITSIGILSTLGVTGTSTLGAVTASTVSAGTIGNSGSTLTGTLSTAAQTNITSVGTLSSLNVSGSISGTLSTGSQPNITSVGTLSSLNVSGAASLGNVSSTSGYFWANGSAYTTAPPSFSVITSDQFTGDGSTNEFYLSANTTTASTVISVNGIVQLPTGAYTISGNVLTMSEPPKTTDVIDARTLATASSINYLTDGTSAFNISNSNGIIYATIQNNNVYVANSSVTTITGSVVPSANVTYDLGTATKRWKDLYLSGTTINLSGATISTNNAGSVIITNITGGSFSVTGTAAGQASGTFGNLIANSGFTSTSTSTGALQVIGGAGISGPVFANNFNGVSVYAGTIGNTGANLVGTISTAAQTNVTSLGTLSALGVTGNSTLGAVTASTVSAGTIGNAGASLQGASIAVTGASTANSYVAISVYAGTIGNTGATLTGTLSTAAQTNITSLGTLTGLTVSGAIVPNGNNTVNLGSTSAWWATMYGQSIQAKYADLAECYVADAVYESGTVLEFGGENEVTLSTTDASPYIAGVVTTDPAYLMNSQLVAEYVAAIALQGRVPTKAIGPIRKGQMVVSAGNGYVRAEVNPAMGTVVGKSLEDLAAGEIKTIEVVVGRM